MSFLCWHPGNSRNKKRSRRPKNPRKAKALKMDTKSGGGPTEAGVDVGAEAAVEATQDSVSRAASVAEAEAAVDAVVSKAVEESEGSRQDGDGHSEAVAEAEEDGGGRIGDARSGPGWRRRADMEFPEKRDQNLRPSMSQVLREIETTY